MIHRPFTITVVGAILVSIGILNAWGIVSTVRIVTEVNGWSNMFSRDGVLLALLAVGAVIELVAGLNILLAKNWARVLWTSWYILVVVLNFFLGIETSLLVQGIQLLFVLLLFLPEADAFFETD